MKTITEFDGFTLNRALNTKKELTTAGKTAEELPQAMGEALKVEGDKLTWLLAALELVESKPSNLKRVIVYHVEEGQKAPSQAVAKGDKYFLTEYFYTPAPKQAPRQDRGPRDKKGGRPGKKGRRRGPSRDAKSAGAEGGASPSPTGEKGVKTFHFKRRPLAEGSKPQKDAGANKPTGSLPKPNLPKPNAPKPSETTS